MAVNTTTEQQRSWMETPPQSPAIKHLSGELIARMPWLDSVSKPLQSWISKLYGEPRAPSYRVKDMLNGTWFGHPLHPVFVTIPCSLQSCSSFRLRPYFACGRTTL